jgi:hypothetical protein
MNMIALRRQMTAFSIAQNPTSITINRTTKTPQGGGLAEAKTTVGPFVVRIFQAKDVELDTVSQMAGTKHKAADFGLLADYQADIRAGPNVTDEFDVSELGHLIVRRVNPQVVNGEVVGYQAVLERVK